MPSGGTRHSLLKRFLAAKQPPLSPCSFTTQRRLLQAFHMATVWNLRTCAHTLRMASGWKSALLVSPWSAFSVPALMLSLLKHLQQSMSATAT